jgi:CBS domain-containing protein
MQGPDTSGQSAPQDWGGLKESTVLVGRIAESGALAARPRMTPTKGRNAMQVIHILQDKGRDVVWLTSGASLADAARLLSERRIGALVIKDADGALAGILSERDLVRALARGGADALKGPVSAFMTPGPATCVETDSVETIMEVMTHGRFRHVPVLDDDEQLCCMISIGDVVKSRLAETVNEAEALREYISTTV